MTSVIQKWKIRNPYVYSEWYFIRGFSFNVKEYLAVTSTVENKLWNHLPILYFLSFMIDKQGKKNTLKFGRNLESSIVTDWDRIELSDKIFRLHPDLFITLILRWSDQISFQNLRWRRSSEGSFIRKSSDEFRFVW